MSRNRSRAAALVLALGVLAGVSGCAAPVQPTPAASAVASTGGGDHDLYLARADRGAVEVDGSTVTLTLEEVASVTWFADRPSRDSGTTTLADALASFGWSGEGPLGSDPPNAVLTATELGSESLVIELASAAVAGSTVTFSVTPTIAARVPSMTLSGIQLFIDPSGGVPGRQTFALSPNLTLETVVTTGGAVLTFVSEGSVLTTVHLSVSTSQVEVDLGEGVLEGYARLTLPTESGPGSVFLDAHYGSGVDAKHFEGVVAVWSAIPPAPPAPDPTPPDEEN